MSERRYADGYRKLRKADEPRRIAYEVLHEVATQGAFANIILPKALRQARRDGHFSDRDAAFTSELVHGTLRAIGRLDWVISSSCAWGHTSFSICACPTTRPCRQPWISHANISRTVLSVS